MLTHWKGHLVLSSAAAYLMLKKLAVYTTGDHDLFIFDVIHHKTNAETGILDLQQLVEKGIIL
jgi:flavin reductase (DIM6/NTAB) family NADH-FMN oxidoreductase RutF